MICLQDTNLIRNMKVRGDILDPLRKGIAIGMLFGSGSGGGGGGGNLMEKTATENGVYDPSDEIDPETEEPYDPPKDGYSLFTVALPLDDKSVSLTTSQITGSQTAEFEYDPHDENPKLEGYSLFTIDLSGVKRDINDLLDQISALEDQLEEMQECCEDVAEILGATPEEGESCCDAVKSKAQEAVDKIEECDNCKAEVVAKLQEYDPDFDPQTCEDIVGKVDDIEKEAKKPPQYTFEQDPTDPTYPDPDFPDKIRDIIGNDNLTDDDVQIEVRYVDEPHPSGHNIYYGFYATDGTFIDRTQAFSGSGNDKLEGFKMLDYTTGSYEFYWVVSPVDVYHYTGTSSYLIGYGDPTHSYTATKNKKQLR